MNENIQLAEKTAAAAKAISMIKDNMVVGLGTGSTSKIAINLLAQKVKQGLIIKAVATSKESFSLAQNLGIKVEETFSKIDFTFDGADKVDPQNQLIKGYGGALFREKIVAKASSFYVIMVDKSKLTKDFCNIPIPVEVSSFGLALTEKKIIDLGAKINLRSSPNGPFTTDNHNFILDCSFETIQNLEDLETSLKLITGVIETGLFLNLADKVIVG